MHFEYGDLKEYEKKYDPEKLKDGWNVVDGEEIFYHLEPGAGAVGVQGTVCRLRLDLWDPDRAV